jgi:hypothetical protein
VKIANENSSSVLFLHLLVVVISEENSLPVFIMKERGEEKKFTRRQAYKTSSMKNDQNRENLKECLLAISGSRSGENLFIQFSS